MALINFIETFFFISLTVTFVLIVMLVYHFKGRISMLEEKCDSIFEILNNVIKELKIMKLASIRQPIVNRHLGEPPIEFDFSNPLQNQNQTQNQNQNQNQRLEPHEENEEEDDDDSEYSDESDDEQEYPRKIVVSDNEAEKEDLENCVKVINVNLEDNDTTYDDLPELEEINDDDVPHLEEIEPYEELQSLYDADPILVSKIIQELQGDIDFTKSFELDNLSDDESVNDTEEISLPESNLEESSVQETNVETSIDDIPEINTSENTLDKSLSIDTALEPAKMDYKKLDISVLRAMVVSRGLTQDSKRMKKNEIVKLLESEDV